MEATMTRRRITRACDSCHSRGVKCMPSRSQGTCEQCISYGSTCSYNRPAKRRGPPPGFRSSMRVSAPQRQSVSDSARQTEYGQVADHETILQLTDFYYRVVYPILLYFHWPTFSKDVRAKRYLRDRSFYALTMAVCATASARIQEKAPLPPSSLNLNFASIPPSRVFYQECMDTLNRLKDVDFNIMRTEALLGMLDLQYNDLGGCVGHLHRYWAMSTISGFHDEANWPVAITEIDLQERRRLFWQCYHFNVYLAVTFGCPMRQRESKCCVKYPAEIYDDEEITETGIVPVTSGAVSFIRGWNFVTDLYRILEHVIDIRRSRNSDLTRPGSNIGLLLDNWRSSKDNIIERDMLLAAQQDWDSLPVELKTALPMTNDIIGDRYGFQAANIIITMTTVKMVITVSEDNTLGQRCALVGELLDNLSSIPTIYVQATSTAMLHHLAGVGHLLSAITNSSLSPWMYLQVRSAILAMADLIDSLQSALNADANVSSKLREHVQQTDTVMEAMKKTNSKNHVLHSALPAGVSCTTAKLPSQKGDQDLMKTVYPYTSNGDRSSSTSQNFALSPPIESHTGEDPTTTAPWPFRSSPPPVQFPSEAFLEWPREFGCESAFYYLGDGGFEGFSSDADRDNNLM